MREILFRAWSEFPKYEVGSNGSIFSLQYNNTSKRGELKQYLDKYGYKYVYLVIDNKRYKRSVHRMVALTFLENPFNKPQVNHKDGVRHNNSLDNLEWVTAQENALHGWKNGRVASEKQKESAKFKFIGSNNPKAKLNIKKVLMIRKLRSEGLQIKDISKMYNISVSQVSSIATFRTWKGGTND